jgi:hypothetical protein
MALVKTDYVYEVLARIERQGDEDRIAGMHVTYLREIVDTETGETVISQPLPAQPLTWAGLAAIMHPDDKASFVAAVAATMPEPEPEPEPQPEPEGEAP